MKVFQERVIFNNSVLFNILPDEGVGTFGSADATPSVKNVRVWKCNTAVVTITDFDDGAPGQVLFVLGHGNTTIDHNANIKTITGAAKTLSADRLYIFVHIDGVWYEN